MKAMILAAGLGTRLRPWTLSHPKALVPVGGVPMLEKVIVRLREQGFDNIVINVNHFAQQVIDYLKTSDISHCCMSLILNIKQANYGKARIWQYTRRIRLHMLIVIYLTN